MKRILMAFGFIMVMATSAIAGHAIAPYVGQERNEKIWTCLDIENTRKYVDTNQYADNGISADDWAIELGMLIGSGECIYTDLSYVVREVLETYEAPYRTRESIWSEEKIPFYILRVDVEGFEGAIIATF